MERRRDEGGRSAEKEGEREKRVEREKEMGQGQRRRWEGRRRGMKAE